MDEGEQPVKRAKNSGVGNSSSSVLPTAVFMARRVECDVAKIWGEALLVKNRFILRLDDETQKLRAKVADIRKASVLAKVASAIRREEKRAKAFGEHVGALETVLKNV